MTEEIFYLDEGHIKIHAASVGISARRWTCINEKDIQVDNYKSLMRTNRFDVLPIVSIDGTTSEFFKTDSPNNYDNISRETISETDVLLLDTSIRDVINGFVSDSKTFYFLIYNNKVTGLITIGNLNCRQVLVYIFGMICELEISLSEFVDENVSKEHLEKYMTVKSATNKKLKKIWKDYQELVSAGLENNLSEHLFLSDFFNIIPHFGLHPKLGFSKKQWKDLSGINELRHLVCHPTRSLLDRNNDVTKLLERIEKIEDLTLRIKKRE